jgi:hypothetical protein
MLDPVPVMVLARLAVHRKPQGIKLDASRLQDAVNGSVMIAQNIGVRALLVDALHERAKEFYQHYAFQASPINPMTLIFKLGKVG